MRGAVSLERPVRRISVEQVKEQLQRDLRLRISRLEVEAYLDEKAIPHSYQEESEFDPKFRRTESAIIRDSYRNFLITGDIQIYFRFDETGRLVDYSVREINTGP